MSKPDMEALKLELEGIEREWIGYAMAEKLSGNVVKEAHYQGTATGLRIAINVLAERDVPNVEEEKGDERT